MSHQVKDYLQNVIEVKLKAEIDAYMHFAEKLSYDGTDIITYNEIAIVSLISTAFTRHEEAMRVWALQEYSVFKNNDEYKGRADLFVRVDNRFDLLIEAKRDGHFKKSDNDKDARKAWVKEVENTIEQGKRYFEAEERYFQNNTFVVSMFFGTYNTNHKVDYFLHPVPDVKNVNDFDTYQFIVNPNDVKKQLCVYGQILKVK